MFVPPKDGNITQWILDNLAEPSPTLIGQVKLMWDSLDETRKDMGLGPTDVDFALGMAEIHFKNGEQKIAYRLRFMFPQQEEVAFFLMLNPNNKIVQIIFQGDHMTESQAATFQ
jgi:hypothetical protein